jgi:poly(3-hydroxybutyrate) depolymerase
MSMGGYFSNFVAAHRADKIAAIAPHSGGLGAVAFAGVKAKHKYAVLVIHGDGDKVVPVREGRQSRDFYEKAGHPIVYEEIEGLGHRWATRQKINDKIWAFFVEHPHGKGAKADDSPRR